MEKELDDIKEAYRRCLTDYEKEKDVKDTLQKCVDIFRQQASMIPIKNDAPNIQQMKQQTPDSKAPVRKDSEEKQRTCRFYNKKNGCSKGDACIFAHTEMPQCQEGVKCRNYKCTLSHRLNEQSSNVEEKKGEKSAENKAMPGGNPGEKKIVCHFYNRKGGCRNGNACKFLHSELPAENEEGRINQGGNDKAKSQNEKKHTKTKTCFFFNRPSGCKKGDNCDFIHQSQTESIGEQQDLRNENLDRTASFLDPSQATTWPPEQIDVAQLIQRHIQIELEKIRSTPITQAPYEGLQQNNSIQTGMNNNQTYQAPHNVDQWNNLEMSRFMNNSYSPMIPQNFHQIDRVTVTNLERGRTKHGN